MRFLTLLTLIALAFALVSVGICSTMGNWLAAMWVGVAAGWIATDLLRRRP